MIRNISKYMYIITRIRNLMTNKCAEEQRQVFVAHTPCDDTKRLDAIK